jgi:hypothetical protein
MISIFYKPTFININPHEPFSKRTKPIPKGRGHLLRVSSMIRADQIAEQIGARLNPESGYENDVCVYVKPMVRKGEDFKFEGHAYLDIIDGWDLIPLMQKHPEVGIITCSKADFDLVSKTVKNKVVLIPQHHCNYNREIRTRNGVNTVGVIGTAGAFPFLPPTLEEELAKRGMELIKFSRFFSRQDIIDFYMKIDVQIVWRSYMRSGKIHLSNPLKLVNASSFGIPTIALDEPAFKEMEDCYIPVDTLEEFLANLEKLRSDPFLYDTYRKRCLIKSEEYHIEKIGELYKKLT